MSDQKSAELMHTVMHRLSVSSSRKQADMKKEKEKKVSAVVQAFKESTGSQSGKVTNMSNFTHKISSKTHHMKAASSPITAQFTLRNAISRFVCFEIAG